MSPASDEDNQPEEQTTINSNSNANIVDQSSLSTPPVLTPDVQGVIDSVDNSGSSYNLTTIFMVVAAMCFAV